MSEMGDNDSREIAVRVLMELWERTENGADRDEISHVRQLLIEWVDEDSR